MTELTGSHSDASRRQRASLSLGDTSSASGLPSGVDGRAWDSHTMYGTGFLPLRGAAMSAAESNVFSRSGY